MALASKVAIGFFSFLALMMKGTPAEHPSAQGGASCSATHTVLSGQSLSTIANTHGVTVSEIQAVNPGITDIDFILPGQAIKIPPCSEPSAVQTPTQSGGPCSKVHTVESGEWLSIIADKHNVSMNAILAYNPDITDPGTIYRGQAIKIPPCSVPAPLSSPPLPVYKTYGECSNLHMVVVGNSINQIAETYALNPVDILAFNPEVTNPNLIQVGQQLRIPPCTEVVSAATSTSTSSPIDPKCGSTKDGCSWSRVTHFKCNGPACNWLLDYACIECGPNCTAAAGSAPGTCGSSCILDEVPEPKCCRLLALCQEYEGKEEAVCMVGDDWLSLNVFPERDPAQSFQVHCDGPRPVSAGFRKSG